MKNGTVRIWLFSALLLGSLAFGAGAGAGVEPAPGASSPKSAKKAAAEDSPLREPEVLEKGDTTVGLRLSQGGVYSGEAMLGANFEHMVTPNIGVGGAFAYGSYNNKFGNGLYNGEWDYTVYSLAVLGNFHADIFKVKNLDTFVTFGLGHALLSSKWRTNDSRQAPLVAADSSTSFFLAYVNARYFLNSKWGLTGSLGTGLGTLAVGVDYLF